MPMCLLSLDCMVSHIRRTELDGGQDPRVAAENKSGQKAAILVRLRGNATGARTPSRPVRLGRCAGISSSRALRPCLAERRKCSTVQPQFGKDEMRTVLACDLGGTSFRAALVDERGQTVAEQAL